MTQPPPQFKVNTGSLRMESADLGYSIHLYVARNGQTNAPLGMAWVQASGNRYIELVDCYVPWWCRRQGVMRWLIRELSRHFPVIVTGCGTSDGGEQFVKSFGFVQDADFGWIYRRSPAGE